VGAGIVLLLILFSNSAVKTKKNVSACRKYNQGEVAGYRRRGVIYENQAKTKSKAKGHIKNSVVSSMLYGEKNLVAGRIHKKNLCK
jgi:hypothetical protein